MGKCNLLKCPVCDSKNIADVELKDNSIFFNCLDCEYSVVISANLGEITNCFNNEVI